MRDSERSVTSQASEKPGTHVAGVNDQADGFPIQSLLLSLVKVPAPVILPHVEAVVDSLLPEHFVPATMKSHAQICRSLCESCCGSGRGPQVGLHDKDVFAIYRFYIDRHCGGSRAAAISVRLHSCPEKGGEGQWHLHIQSGRPSVCCIADLHPDPAAS